MDITVDRGMVVQAVLDGQIGSEHVTVDELIFAHHLLADAVVSRCMQQASYRSDVLVFGHDWQWFRPN